MQSGKRALLRLAHAIHAANAEIARPPKRELPEAAWGECRNLARRLEYVDQKGWAAAAHQVRRDLDRAAGDLQRQLTAMRDSLRIPPPTPFASPAEILADLMAIDQEFDELTWNGKERTIAVSTPPIAFDDVPLGRFWIELRWKSLRPLRLGCYHIIAREPNPAGTDESVTHPHVQDEFLCEGEAQTAIQRALAEGRLFDFFVLVRSVLETYNSASPYMPIEDWGGIRCGDCDAHVPRDEVNRCCACSTRLCDDCRSLCSSCDDDFCGECIGRCAVCDESCCSGCLTPCARCGNSTCRGCLPSNDTCENCHEQEQDETSEPDAAVQPHSLGQAPVPA